MADRPAGPQLAAAAVMMRDDDAILLVRQPSRSGETGPFDDHWTLPLSAVAEHETAEDAVDRVLRQQLHVAPRELEFSDTIYLIGVDGSRFIVNAFLCVGWEGEPRFSERDYADAAWAVPGRALALQGDLADGMADWIARSFEREASAPTPEALEAELTAARNELLTAFEAIPLRFRDEPLEGEWSPLDVVGHAADAEAYYAAEARRIATTPGHTWRPFNESQWDDARGLRRRVNEPEPADAVRARIDAVRAETRRWLTSLTVEDLAIFGNHAERGAVQVADRIDKIARHDREHAGQLRAMGHAARVLGSSKET